MCVDFILALDHIDLEPFEDRDDNKERKNKSKERRISISLVILTFLASVCVLFGTLFPELSRGEIDMVPWRNVILTTGKIQPHLIKDKITLVNLGLWRYCYDDQLYDLVELINPYYRSSVKKRNADNETVSIEKRQAVREGDISIRCHSVPEPWKMPYHVKNKTEATKVCLLIGIVMCIVSFLLSILVLITRLPILKLLQLVACFLAVVSTVAPIGIAFSDTINRNDAMPYQEVYTRRLAGYIMGYVWDVELGIDLHDFGVIFYDSSQISWRIGLCSVFVFCAAFVMTVCVFLVELNRHLGR